LLPFAAPAPLTLLAAGSAAVAPDDVALSASASGGTVTRTITNNTDGADLFCMVYGTIPGTSPEVDPLAFSAGLGEILTGGALDPVTVPAGTSPLTFPGILVGEYQVDWVCANNLSSQPMHEEWGTPSAISIHATVQPALVTVDATPARPPLFGP
jgi:hypothetical protein